MSKGTHLCRFCANELPTGDIIDLKIESKIRETVKEKLSFFSVNFVNFNDINLPESVCKCCIANLDNCYEFFRKVKESQITLSQIMNDEDVVMVKDYNSSEDETFCDGIEEIEFEYSSSSSPDISNSPIFDTSISPKPERSTSPNPETSTSPTPEKSTSPTPETSISPTPETSISPTPETSTSPTPETSTSPNPDPSWTSYKWLCGHCEHTSAAITDLRKHIKENHKTCYGYQCADCDEKIDVFEDFVSHVRSHKKDLREYCEYCNLKIEDYYQHIETHLSSNFCTFCGETFEEESDLLLHLKTYASKDTGLLAFDMVICDSEDSGEISTWSDYPSVCRFCKMKVLSKDILSYHCMEVHGSCFGMQCVDCDKSPENFMEFVHHVGTHRPEFKSLCPYCEIQIDEADAQFHLETHTTNHYPCFICGEIFFKKRALRYHELKTITPKVKPKKVPITTKDLTCDQCGFILKTLQALRGHKLLHTERRRDYTCDKCGLTFYTKGALTAHSRTHEKAQKVICKICNKTLANYIRLRKHLQTHNLEKPFQCDHCKKYFSTKDRLRPHMLIHMDIKRHKCLYCEKKFRHRSLLTVHENQHTGARPYHCNICLMEFANWSNCNKHMKRKHNKTLAKSVMTPQGRISLNPKTGKPQQLEVNNVVKEWSENILKGKRKSRQNIGFRLEKND